MKKIIIALLFLLSISFPITPLFAATPKPSSESAEIDPETIKENIKKRIEQAAKSQPQDLKKKTAFLGTLSSITTNSFVLETEQGGAKQASTSAATTVIELPRNKEIKFADVSIGDHITALGFINETTKVLDARRILVLKEPPVKPSKKTAFGSIVETDFKKSLLTINVPTNEQSLTFKVNSKTKFSLSDGSITVNKADLKTATLNSKVAIIYQPAENGKGTPVATTVLYKSDLPLPAASASAEIDSATNN